jgi:hypothetical protein
LRTAARWIAKAAVALVVWTFVGPFVVSWLPTWLPTWLGTLLTVAVVVIAASLRWRRGGRSVTAPRTGREWLVAATPVVLGLAVTAASDYWFGHHNVYVKEFGPGVIGPVGDVLISLPFWLISTLVFFRGLSYAATAIATAALGALVVLVFDSVASSTSSTAAVGYLAPWFTGIPLIVVVFLVDRALHATQRGWRARRASRLGHAREM